MLTILIIRIIITSSNLKFRFDNKKPTPLEILFFGGEKRCVVSLTGNKNNNTKSAFRQGWFCKSERKEEKIRERNQVENGEVGYDTG